MTSPIHAPVALPDGLVDGLDELDLGAPLLDDVSQPHRSMFGGGPRAGLL